VSSWKIQRAPVFANPCIVPDRQIMKNPFWKYVLVFGLMSASWNAIWGIYNNYVPIFLQAGNPGFDLAHKTISFGFGLTPFWAGIVMSLDNFLAIILCPLVGAVSDRIRRRAIFILTGAPLAIMGSAILPTITYMITEDKSGDLSTLTVPFSLFILCAMILILGYTSASTLVSALILDIIPSTQQTKLFSYILMVGSCGTLIVYGLSGILYRINRIYPFVMGSLILLFAVVAFKLIIKEPFREKNPEIRHPTASRAAHLFSELGLLTRDERSSLLAMLGTIFFFQFGFAGFQTYVSSYALNVMKIPEANTIYISLAFMAGVLIMTVPASMIASRIGRRATIRIGLVSNIIFPLIAYFSPNPRLIFAIFVIFGMSLTLISVNQIPVIGGIVTSTRMAGKLVGLLWVTTTLSTLVAVPVSGWLIGLSGTNYNLLWLITAGTMLISFGVLFRVRGGEVQVAEFKVKESTQPIL